MASLNFIGGEKGGVGKSVVARLLAQYCIDRKQPFIGFDTDRSHASFRRFYGEFAAHTVVDDYASLDHIAEAISSDPARHVLVDLAAQTMPPLTRWIEDSGLLALLAEERIPVRFWHVMDDGLDSLGLLERLLATITGPAAFAVVLNHGRGADFTRFHSSPVKKAAVARGAAIIELRRLHETSMRKIDHSNSSFWAAVHQRGGEQALGLLERQRVKIWLASTYEDLARVMGA